MVEDSGIRLVERGAGWFGIWDGVVELFVWGRV
jgi:hypothetical protein